MKTLRIDIDETPFPHALAQLIAIYEKQMPIVQLIEEVEIAQDALREELAIQALQSAR